MADKTIYISKSIILKPNENRICDRENSQNLTEKEKRLLLALAKNKNYIVSHAEIAEAVWPERSAAIGLNNILQLIFRLRRKLDLIGISHCIYTVAGKGYCLKEIADEDNIDEKLPVFRSMLFRIRRHVSRRRLCALVLSMLMVMIGVNISYDGRQLLVPLPAFVLQIAHVGQKAADPVNINPVPPGLKR